ncbi:patatin-like phospholipase family protein [Patescibacteria group bacterium]|nr:patatin-like phospholipase family protein [Patescibacteria group bacterium]
MILFKKNIKKVGLVLGGGGARGFFHIGVLKALKEKNIKITEISGTSIGAIIGAVYCSDPQIDFNKILGELNLLKILTKLEFSDKKTVENLIKFLKTFIKADNFSDLKIPLSFNATDINTGEEIIFKDGPLFPALISSMAIPGIFPPVEIDGKYLSDGGILDNTPIKLIKKNKHILLSNLDMSLLEINKNDRISVLKNSIKIMQRKESIEDIHYFKNMKKIKLLSLNPDIAINSLDFRKKNYKELINYGYQLTLEKLENEKFV